MINSFSLVATSVMKSERKICRIAFFGGEREPKGGKSKKIDLRTIAHSTDGFSIFIKIAFITHIYLLLLSSGKNKYHDRTPPIICRRNRVQMHRFDRYSASARVTEFDCSWRKQLIIAMVNVSQCMRNHRSHRLCDVLPRSTTHDSANIP